MKKKKGDEFSKTDELIDQALEDVAGGEIASVEQESAKKVAKIDLQQYVDKETYVRLMADFDNFRKRALKERAEWERQGKEKVLRGFLDIYDNLLRGLQQAEKDESALAVGMKMVATQVEMWLESEGLKRIKTVGENFDPNVHHAVARKTQEGSPDGLILEEVKRGYMWGDRLIRPAAVVVVKSPDEGGD